MQIDFKNWHEKKEICLFGLLLTRLHHNLYYSPVSDSQIFAAQFAVI